MATALDSTIFGPLFADPEISALLTDEAYVRALVEVEVALARAEARLDIIPPAAAEQITGAANPANIDIAALAKGTARSGFPIIALVQELRRVVGPEAGPYLHWGATTQDIMDSACVLQLRTVIKVFEKRLAELAGYLSALAQRHQVTVVAGRTHGQQALPVSFGLKVASWLAPLVRDSQRLNEISSRLLVVQFGGAAGTLAALGDRGLELMHGFASELGLTAPVMPWHAQRDSFVEFAGWLSLVTGSLGKMAQDIVLMAQTEVGELAESAEEGRGGSSTMPQKSNPITSELIIAAARMNASLLSALHHALIQEQERATHGWQIEWLSLPQMAILTSGALKHAVYLAKSLQVDEVKMRENLHRANDVALAEAAVFALSGHLPRPQADELVRQACAAAVSEGRPLIEVVKRLAGGVVSEGAVDWQALAAPENYLGESERIIQRVLEDARKLWQPHATTIEPLARK
ncbi:MAG: 3-carboxy-cis,cis-muconate cycloisomerase [Candidatus Binatia bacterium]